MGTESGLAFCVPLVCGMFNDVTQLGSVSVGYFGLRVPVLLAQSTDEYVSISLPCTSEI